VFTLFVVPMFYTLIGKETVSAGQEAAAGAGLAPAT
jgi:hypothetical protein